MEWIMKIKLFLAVTGIIVVVSIIAHTIAFKESPLKNEMSLNNKKKNHIKHTIYKAKYSV